MTSSQIAVPNADFLPRHVAIIMDGNGRWATQAGLPRLDGHRRGADVVRDITTFAREIGISFLTLFSFSRQNWARGPIEVAGLMQLLEDYCQRERATLMKNEIRLTTVGDLHRLPESTRRALTSVMSETANNTKMTLTLALDYGSREEIVKAVQRLANDIVRRRLRPEDIDEACLSGSLDTGQFPDPDLIIRTSGEQRLSNFLLWQSAYAELHFTPVYWPNFTRADFAKALMDYASRERRFGGLGESVAPTGDTPAPPAADLSKDGKTC